MFGSNPHTLKYLGIKGIVIDSQWINDSALSNLIPNQT
jgi:hypothetical protein